MRRLRHHRFCLIAAFAVLALASPAAAQADSITYLDVTDFNIWVAAPDGSQAHAVTQGGTADDHYFYPSQADDGTILATRNDQLVRMDRQGNVLGVIDTLAGGAVKGPFDVKISPDGTKAAYEVYVETSYETPGGVFLEEGFYTIWQNARTGAFIGDFTSSWETPAWTADSQHALVADPYAYITHQLGYVAAGGGNHDVAGWLFDRDHPMGYSELTRAEDKLVSVQAPASNAMPGDPGNELGVMRVSGHSGDPIGEQCSIHSQDGSAVRDPSWSPDGTSLVWWDNQGMWTSPFDGSCGSLAPRNIVPTGGKPDWGPAAPSASGSATLAAPRAIKAAKLRKGLRLRIGSADPATARIVVKDAKRTIARRSAKVPATVRIKLPAKARRRLGRRGHRKLTVKVSVAGKTLKRTVKVRR